LPNTLLPGESARRIPINPPCCFESSTLGMASIFFSSARRLRRSAAVSLRGLAGGGVGGGRSTCTLRISGLGCVASGSAASPSRRRSRKAPMRVLYATMITLFQGPPAFGLPNLSPFCLKVELYLKMAGLPYKTALGDPRKAPKGKIPWIDDDGQIVADSSFILDYLRKKYGEKLDAPLTTANRVIALTAQRMIEEQLYFAPRQLRWGEDEIFKETRATFASLIPLPLRGIVTNKIRKGTLAKLHEQGIGRHKPDEIYALANSDLDALCALLGDE